MKDGMVLAVQKSTYGRQTAMPQPLQHMLATPQSHYVAKAMLAKTLAILLVASSTHSNWATTISMVLDCLVLTQISPSQ